MSEEERLRQADLTTIARWYLDGKLTDKQFKDKVLDNYPHSEGLARSIRSFRRVALRKFAFELIRQEDIQTEKKDWE